MTGRRSLSDAELDALLGQARAATSSAQPPIPSEQLEDLVDGVGTEEERQATARAVVDSPVELARLTHLLAVDQQIARRARPKILRWVVPLAAAAAVLIVAAWWYLHVPERIAVDGQSPSFVFQTRPGQSLRLVEGAVAADQPVAWRARSFAEAWNKNNDQRKLVRVAADAVPVAELVNEKQSHYVILATTGTVAEADAYFAQLQLTGSIPRDLADAANRLRQAIRSHRPPPGVFVAVCAFVTG